MTAETRFALTRAGALHLAARHVQAARLARLDCNPVDAAFYLARAAAARRMIAGAR